MCVWYSVLTKNDQIYIFPQTASIHPTKVSEYVQGMSEADSSGTRGGRKKAGKVKKLAKGKESSRLYVEFGLEFMSTGEVGWGLCGRYLVWSS